MNFEYHEIGEFSYRMGETSLVDVDNDNDLDWVFGSFGEMYWYEYISPTDWKLHEIGKGAKTDVGGCPIDVNHDGWIDFVVGDSWYENTGKPQNENFILHKKNMIGTHDNVAVDIDGDGIKDIVSLSNHPDHPVLAW
ncbi:MAG: VCBS repeat-containing protein, partial [Cyclobacteriaceae bacterium]|nr:VCBS repeat-containing protein [Cyclobacteriaceae bacterium]